MLPGNYFYYILLVKFVVPYDEKRQQASRPPAVTGVTVAGVQCRAEWCVVAFHDIVITR
jgi:hypothetical protein